MSLPILGVLVNQVRATNNSQERVKQIKELFGEQTVFSTMVPMNEKIEEGNDQEKSGYDFAPDAKGVAAYAAIVKEVVARVTR